MNTLAKLNEILLDLREIKNPSQIEHQARKLEKVIEQLETVFGDEPDITPNVHGSGTGKGHGND